MTHKKKHQKTWLQTAKRHLALRAKVTGVSPSIALLHEIADHFGYQYEALSHLRQISTRRQTPIHSIYYLRRRGFVKSRRIGNRLEICLTKEGEQRVWRDRLRATSRKVEGGRVCIVIFDFPESEKRRREQWRTFLKWLGMRYLQKSVWYTDRDIGSGLAAKMKREGLEEWIHVLEAKILTK